MSTPPLSETEKKVLLALIEGLSLVSRPYEEIAQKIGLTEEEVLASITTLKEKKIIRRLGATLRHNLVGYEGNAMVAWRVPEERLDEVGPYLASQPFVTHCYVRKSYPDWPYNLYTMCHAKTREELIELLQRVAQELHLKDYQILFTSKEIRRKHAQYNIE